VRANSGNAAKNQVGSNIRKPEEFIGAREINPRISAKMGNQNFVPCDMGPCDPVRGPGRVNILLFAGSTRSTTQPKRTWRHRRASRLS